MANAGHRATVRRATRERDEHTAQLWAAGPVTTCARRTAANWRARSRLPVRSPAAAIRPPGYGTRARSPQPARTAMMRARPRGPCIAAQRDQRAADPLAAPTDAQAMIVRRSTRSATSPVTGGENHRGREQREADQARPNALFRIDRLATRSRRSVSATRDRGQEGGQVEPPARPNGFQLCRLVVVLRVERRRA